jgi:hypothetical protein
MVSMLRIIFAFFALMFLTGQTSETFTNYINGLPVATSVGASDQFYIRQGAASKQVLASTISTFVSPASALSTYGAKCDGATNDDAAIASWLAATVAVGKPAYFQGQCAFNTPIVLPAVDKVTITGASPGTSILKYTGSNTTSDIISIASGGGQHHFWSFQNWQLTSNTTMVSGAALHLQQVVRSNLLNWWACTQDCTNNFYHGVWFDQVDSVVWCGVSAKAQQDAVRVNGQSGGPQSDVWLDCGGKISGGQVGVRIGGAFGGFYCGAVDIIANNRNVVIDTTLTASANFQSLFSSLCILDSSLGVGMQISDTLSAAGSPGIVLFNGTWFASAGQGAGTTNHCVLIDAGVTYPIYFNSATVTNCSGDGIHNNSSVDHLVVTGGRVASNSGYGIFSVAPTTGVNFVTTDTVNNTSGAASTNVTIAVNCPSGITAATATFELGSITKCM